jgi:hypothetical protein
MTEQVIENQFPSETVELPSKGVFYPEGSPLRAGKLDIYLMTAKHEDILTSSNLIQKGVVLDKLMDALIATKGVKSSDLLIGDLNAVMVAARILGYGKDYVTNIRCPVCGETKTHNIDISELGFVNEPEVTAAHTVTLTLPVSGATVELKFLTRGDEKKVEEEVKGLKKISNDAGSITANLRAIIKSVNGDTASTTIWKFVDSLLVKDSRYLRAEYAKLLPDVDFNVTVTCDCSDTPIDVRLPIGTDFFWPDSRV